MPRFSANLGLLWRDRPLAEAIKAAAEAGFDAVECHWPFDVPVAEMRAALQETGLEMLGLNTRRGDVAAGDNGLAAVPKRENEARAAIDEALDYAASIRCPSVHVMAGRTRHLDITEQACFDQFIDNLRYGCAKAEAHHQTLLIEPLNPKDAPDYFLNSLALARRVIETVGMPNLKLMFDCYHIALLEGEVAKNLQENLDIIGHIQFAGVPDRGHPDISSLDYASLFQMLDEIGYDRPLGAEYHPDDGDTNASLDWLARWKKPDLR